MKHMKRKRALWFMCLLLCAGTLLAQEYRMDKAISYRPDSKDEYVQKRRRITHTSSSPEILYHI